MKNNKKLLLAFILVFISIGVAFLSSNLSILGSTVISKNKWNIYFDNVVNIKGENLATQAPTTTGTTTTDISYKVTLSKPGDIYKFNVDIVNDGTIDAMVKVITNTNLTAEQKKYINYSITYVDEAPIEKKNFLGHGDTQTLAVTVEYKKDIIEEDLKAEDEEITVQLHLEYEQADNTKVTREPHKLTVKYDWNYNFVSNNFNTGLDGWYVKNTTDGTLVNIDNNITYNGSPSVHIYTTGVESFNGIAFNYKQNYNLDFLTGHSYYIHICIYKDSESTLGGVSQEIRYYKPYKDDSRDNPNTYVSLFNLHRILKEKQWVCTQNMNDVPEWGKEMDTTIQIDSYSVKEPNNFWIADPQFRILDSEKYNYNDTINTLPTPIREGYTFDGWYTDPFGGNLVQDGVKVTESTTYYAHWR